LIILISVKDEGFLLANAAPKLQAATFTSLLSKVVFSTLYADVKEHMLDHWPSKRFDLEFFRLLVSNIKMVSFMLHMRMRSRLRGSANPVREVVGLTGLEPVTLRLSSACSNQLSYRPFWIAVIAGIAVIERQRQAPNLSFSALLAFSAFSALQMEVRGLEPLTYSLQSYRSTS
jgi:hypothetical protein